MKKYQILQTAISKNLDKKQIGENSTSAFFAVHQCINAINLTELTEEQKKERFIHHLQSFWRGNSSYVVGCKRKYIQKIIELVFGIKNANDTYLYKEIRSFTFQELYLYYCYIERLANGDPYFSKLLWEYFHVNQKTVIQKIIEKEREKEEENKLEEIKIKKLTKEELWQYEILEKKQDMLYYQKFINDNTISIKNKITIAKLLKKCWETAGKWEGGHISEKQRKKIAKIKELLEE